VVEKIQDDILRPERRPEKEDTVDQGQIATKVCTREQCVHGGKPQPLASFDTHSASKDGKAYMCKDCRRQVQRSRATKLKADRAPVSPKPIPAPAPQPLAPAPIAATTKACKKCGLPKPIDYFRKNKECRDGHEGTCRDCHLQRRIELRRVRREQRAQLARTSQAAKPAAQSQGDKYNFKLLADLLSGRKRYDHGQLTQIRDLCRTVAEQVETYLTLHQIFRGGAPCSKISK
jgi:hypothetical protein